MWKIAKKLLLKKRKYKKKQHTGDARLIGPLDAAYSFARLRLNKIMIQNRFG